MESDEKIQAHILSVWREGKEFVGGSSLDGMLFLTNRHLMFIRKTESKMRWWGAVTQRQVVRLIQSKDVMLIQDGYNEENLKKDLENKKNQEISFNEILNIDIEEKVWGSALILEILVDDKKKKYQFSVVQDWVKYPIKAPMKFMKVDWSRFVKYIKDKQLVTK